MPRAFCQRLVVSGPSSAGPTGLPVANLVLIRRFLIFHDKTRRIFMMPRLRASSGLPLFEDSALEAVQCYVLLTFVHTPLKEKKLFTSGKLGLFSSSHCVFL